MLIICLYGYCLLSLYFNQPLKGNKNINQYFYMEDDDEKNDDDNQKIFLKFSFF